MHIWWHFLVNALQQKAKTDIRLANRERDSLQYDAVGRITGVPA